MIKLTGIGTLLAVVASACAVSTEELEGDAAERSEDVEVTGKHSALSIASALLCRDPAFVNCVDVLEGVYINAAEAGIRNDSITSFHVHPGPVSSRAAIRTFAAYVARVGRMQLDAGQRKSPRSSVKRVHLRVRRARSRTAGDGVCVARAGHGVTRRAARERVRQNGGYRAGLIGRGPWRAEGVGGGPLMAAVLEGSAEGVRTRFEVGARHASCAC